VSADSKSFERNARSWLLVAGCLFLGNWTLGCGAVFPELSTPIRDVPPTFELTPPPPDDLVFLAVVRAAIPEKTRDGRAWDSVGGSLPDPFAKVIVNGRDLLVTPVQTDTLTPTWPNQRRGNYRVPVGARIRVELWDSNPINNHPICVQELRELHEELSTEARVEIRCDSGAYLELIAEPAHGKLGAGLFYEMRTDQVFVVRVLRESPAARAGIKAGQEITRINGESTRGMASNRVRSLLNANVNLGVELELKNRSGESQKVTLKDGAIYPGVDEDLL
jgi:hypothetical protein